MPALLINTCNEAKRAFHALANLTTESRERRSTSITLTRVTNLSSQSSWNLNNTKFVLKKKKIQGMLNSRWQIPGFLEVRNKLNFWLYWVVCGQEYPRVGMRKMNIWMTKVKNYTVQVHNHHCMSINAFGMRCKLHELNLKYTIVQLESASIADTYL